MRPNFHQSGFTLLETLLVVAVLGVVILGSFSLSTSQNQGQRFDDSSDRLRQLKESTIGRVEAQYEADQLLTGFVPDLGRLPNNIRELLSQGDLPTWTYDETADQWSGWRGPYLTRFDYQSGLPIFTDGWGYLGDTNNFGWRFEVDHSLGTLLVQSYGADGTSGGSGYDLDYPTNAYLVTTPDAFVDLANWRISVSITNPAGGGGSALPAEDATVRVRLYYPQDGALDWPETWPPSSLERDESPYISLAQLIESGSVADGESELIEFDFGADTKRVPIGIRTLGLVSDDDGAVFGNTTQATGRVTLLSRVKAPTTSLAWNLE